MSSDALRESVNRVPFHPIIVHMPSGKTVTVDNPELVMFNETGRTMIVAKGERVMLIDVATVELVETVAD